MNISLAAIISFVSLLVMSGCHRTEKSPQVAVGTAEFGEIRLAICERTFALIVTTDVIEISEDRLASPNVHRNQKNLVFIGYQDNIGWTARSIQSDFLVGPYNLELLCGEEHLIARDNVGQVFQWTDQGFVPSTNTPPAETLPISMTWRDTNLPFEFEFQEDKFFLTQTDDGRNLVLEKNGKGVFRVSSDGTLKRLVEEKSP